MNLRKVFGAFLSGVFITSITSPYEITAEGLITAVIVSVIGLILVFYPSKKHKEGEWKWYDWFGLMMILWGLAFFGGNINRIFSIICWIVGALIILIAWITKRKILKRLFP